MRNVRPSWVNVYVAGVKADGHGPLSRTGELRAEFLVRSKGSIADALTVRAVPSDDGLTTTYIVRDADGHKVWERTYEQ